MLRPKTKDESLFRIIIPLSVYNVEGPDGGGGAPPPPPPADEPAFNPELFRSGGNDPSDVIPRDPPLADEPKPNDPPAPIIPPIPPTERQLVSYWDHMKKTLGENYKIPEVVLKGKKEDGTDLTLEDEFEIFRTELYNNTDFEEDDFTTEYKIAKKEAGFDKQQWLQNKLASPSTLTDDDFLFVAYKQQYGVTDARPNGLTEEQIKGEIEKMSMITKKGERGKIESAMQKSINEKNLETAKQNNAKFEANIIKANEENAVIVSNYIKSIAGKTTIEGIEFSEAEMLDYQKSLPELMKVEVVTRPDGRKEGITKAQQYLEKIVSTEEGSMALLPLVYMIEKNKLKGYSSFLKESVKKELEKKLGITPDNDPGGSANSPTQFDGNLFRSGTGTT